MGEIWFLVVLGTLLLWSSLWTGWFVSKQWKGGRTWAALNFAHLVLTFPLVVFVSVCGWDDLYRLVRMNTVYQLGGWILFPPPGVGLTSYSQKQATDREYRPAHGPFRETIRLDAVAPSRRNRYWNRPFAALVIEGDNYQVLSNPERPGSVDGQPRVWKKTVDAGKVQATVVPAAGNIGELLHPATEIVQDSRLAAARAVNPFPQISG